MVNCGTQPTTVGVRALSLLLLLFFVLLPVSDLSAAPVIVDADRARELSQRKGRDAIEGLWGVYHEWYPSETAWTYRVAVVKNTFGVFPKAKYIGVVTCERDGCIRGEVRMLFTPVPKSKNEYLATFVTASGDVTGSAHLGKDDDGRQNSAIDMRSVKMEGRVLTNWILRIIDM